MCWPIVADQIACFSLQHERPAYAARVHPQILMKYRKNLRNLRMKLTFMMPFSIDNIMKVEENELLVHEGEMAGDLESLVERIRDERDADVLGLQR
jgi:hypothetical protein